MINTMSCLLNHSHLELVISRKQRDHHYDNYGIIKFSIRDKVGSLVSALEVFQVGNHNYIMVYID
jgi:hypothetical protein